jgi:DNA-binding PadR family transcriptional regulator
MHNEAKAGVLQGTLDLMVLQALATLGPLHGYASAARIEQVSSGAIQLYMGTLYPGLLRLEQRGFVARSGTGPKRIGERDTTASLLPAPANYRPKGRNGRGWPP